MGFPHFHSKCFSGRIACSTRLDIEQKTRSQRVLGRNVISFPAHFPLNQSIAETRFKMYSWSTWYSFPWFPPYLSFFPNQNGWVFAFEATPPAPPRGATTTAMATMDSAMDFPRARQKLQRGVEAIPKSQRGFKTKIVEWLRWFAQFRKPPRQPPNHDGNMGKVIGNYCIYHDSLGWFLPTWASFWEFRDV